MAAGSHWAASLVGRPWAPGAEGPDSFDCWGLVRYVFRARHGIVMPAVAIDSDSEEVNVRAIKRASQVSGWRLVLGDPAPDDILLLRGFDGRRHVGIVIEAERRLRLLHANGSRLASGRCSGAVETPALADALLSFRSPESWRRCA
jgi:cell wall-associated NlpC family hydrolase